MLPSWWQFGSKIKQPQSLLVSSFCWLAGFSCCTALEFAAQWVLLSKCQVSLRSTSVAWQPVLHVYSLSSPMWDMNPPSCIVRNLSTFIAKEKIIEVPFELIKYIFFLSKSIFHVSQLRFIVCCQNQAILTQISNFSWFLPNGNVRSHLNLCGKSQQIVGLDTSERPTHFVIPASRAAAQAAGICLLCLLCLG